MAVVVKEKLKEKELGKITKPSFRNPATMTKEELTDPDYAMKQIIRLFGNGKNEELLLCSKCHHCR